eukprot:g30486.t1
MSVRGVKCCTYEVWEICDTSNISDNYICRKCTQLQLLTDCMERQLDALRTMRMAESVIDSSFRDVATPKVQADRWVATRRGRQPVQESPVVVPLSNKYTI